MVPLPSKVGHLIILFSVCFHVLLLHETAAAATTNNTTNTTTAAAAATGGLEISLELIHRDSERSPYYTPGLSDDERYERLVELSKARVRWLKSSSSSRNANLTVTDIRPPVYQSTSCYMVAMKVGSGAGSKEYLLEFDTGSAITWIQCKPCEYCYPQVSEIFEPWQSSSYRQIPCSDPLCDLGDPDYQCVQDVCNYQINYGDQSSVKGKLSRETFGFMDVSGRGTQSVPNLAFGCSHSNHVNHAEPHAAGLLGMNAEAVSFASQLAGGFGHGVFSYCFPPLGPDSLPRRSGYLRFGVDIPRMPRMQMTPLEIPADNPHYYVTLFDISVAGQRLNLDPRIFLRRDHRNGVVVDTGTGITNLIRQAFDPAKAVLQAYFARYGLAPIDRRRYDKCFPAMVGVERILPSLTFHFQGATLEVPGAYMFRKNVRKNAYCWKMVGDDDMTIIGAAQQVNTRFAFDLRLKMMMFAPEDCASTP